MSTFREFACCDAVRRCFSGTILALFLIAAASPLVIWREWSTVSKADLMGRDLHAHVTLYDAAGAKRAEFDARVSTSKRPYGWRIEEVVTSPSGRIERNTWRIDRLTRSAVRRNLLLRVDRDGDADARGVWSMIARAKKIPNDEAYRARKSIYHPGVGQGRLEVRFVPTVATARPIAARETERAGG